MVFIYFSFHEIAKKPIFPNKLNLSYIEILQLCSAMEAEKLTIGRYLIIKTIGKGGMGEVLLAYDPICKRNVALKKIRPDLQDNPRLKNRFLKEAKIASRLTHPSIIAIYAIHTDENGIYYTMPYVEGVMLKDLLEEAQKNQELQNTKGSIAYLTRVFLSVCEAMAYSHSKNILHRDLKPANIMIGKYGEVLILDWGIANFINDTDDDEEPSKTENPKITKPGKIAGTVAFMAPERAFGKNATVLTDIYALGVILYQILTLKTPFQRRNLSNFKKTAQNEKLIDPIERAPDRDIPSELSEICKKCLCYEPEKRYQSVEEIIQDLMNYIQGNPRWILSKELDIADKSDWAINENVFFSKHTAITQNSDLSEWVNLLIAKKPILGNIKVEADIMLYETFGLGFLLCVAEPKEKFAVESGYLLFLGVDNEPFVQLIRSNALVMEIKNVDLKKKVWHHIKIEKNETTFSFFLDDKPILSYASHIPLSGTYHGLIFKDFDFKLKNLKFFSSSNNVVVNCLAIPDAFLAKKDFDTAYAEYKKIAQSFPGRMEGVQALFRAGVSLLEKARKTDDKLLFQKALDEFENLHKTHGAPLEYLGKSLVYSALKEYEEEAKCLELAIRKFKNHPLLPILKEHIIYRIHESSLQERESTYRLILLTLLHIPSFVNLSENKLLVDNLQNNLEKLYFILPSPLSLPIDLAYRLRRKQAILEIINFPLEKEEENRSTIENGLFALLELLEFEELKKMNLEKYPLFTIALNSHKNLKKAFDAFFSAAPKVLDDNHLRTLIHMLKHGLDIQDLAALKMAFEKLKNYQIPKEYKELIDSLKISYFLLIFDLEASEALFKKYPLEKLSDETSYLHPIYGIYLYLKNPQKAMKHFSSVLEASYPKTTSLLSHYLTERIEKWIAHALYFEKKELYRQLTLFYHCTKEDKKRDYFYKMVNEPAP